MMWGRARREKALVERFIAAFNARDMAALRAMMTEDFTYIDSWREGVSGRDTVMPLLVGMFELDPEFTAEIETLDWRAPHVLVTGRVYSRHFGTARRALWQVLVRDGKVCEYQSWAEGGPPRLSRTVAPEHVRDLSDRASAKPILEEGC